MSIEGTAQTEYASLSGKIQTFVVDKTLSISGACADAKATGDAIEKIESLSEEAKEAYDKAIEGMSEAAKEAIKTLTPADIGAYSKDETLSDETKTLFGLDASAVPNDIFTALANASGGDDGGAKIATGSYVGTGTYGVSNPCTITLDFTPKLVMAYPPEDLGWLFGYKFYWDVDEGSYGSDSQPAHIIFAPYGAKSAYRVENGQTEVVDRFTWGENSFSWYTDGVSGYSGSAEDQLNKSGQTYHYLAIG